VSDVRSLVDFRGDHAILCFVDLLFFIIKTRMHMAPKKGKRAQDKKDKPIANPTVVLREEFDDWAILFNPDTAEAVGTNPVGVAVWKLMDGRRTLEQIVVEIHDQFADVPDAAEKDVTAFIQDLAQRGFIGYEVKDKG
jgi:SynChlorMet cassette protein ScmD